MFKQELDNLNVSSQSSTRQRGMTGHETPMRHLVIIYIPALS